MEQVSHQKNVDISKLKHSFATKFPFNALSQILLREHNEMTIDELISKVGTWLAILDAERGRDKYIKGGK